MKKLLLSLLFILSSLSWGQQIYSYRIVNNGVNANGSSLFSNTSGLAATYPSLSWIVNGTLASCSIQLNYSNDGSTIAGQLIPAQSCTSSGSIIISGSSTTSYVQVAYTIIPTGGGFLSFVGQGCLNSSCTNGTLPSSCTVSIITGLVNCTAFMASVITANTFAVNGLNGGQTLNLGNGSGTGSAINNAILYGNNTINNPCIENIIATLDEGCTISAGFEIPSIDRSIGMTLSAMGAQSTATLTPITNMIWNLVASKNYIGWCEIPVTFAASATIQFGLIGPGTPTSYNIDAYGLIGAAAVYGDFNLVGQTTWVTTKTGASGAPGATTQIVHVNFQIQNGTTTGLLTLNTAANGTNTITVGANAICHVIQQN